MNNKQDQTKMIVGLVLLSLAGYPLIQFIIMISASLLGG